MRIEIVGDVKDQPEGSGMVELDLDEEGTKYLLQLGFETLLNRGMDAMKKDKEMYERNR